MRGRSPGVFECPWPRAAAWRDGKVFPPPVGEGQGGGSLFRQQPTARWRRTALPLVAPPQPPPPPPPRARPPGRAGAHVRRGVGGGRAAPAPALLMFMLRSSGSPASAAPFR